MKKLNLIVLASGGGTNLQAIIDNIEAGKLFLCPSGPLTRRVKACQVRDLSGTENKRVV